MSTDLYQVQVLSISGSKLTCRVTAHDPDAGLPPSRTLALQFLWEPWLYFSQGLFHRIVGADVTLDRAEDFWRTTAIGRELADWDICDGDWTRANVARFIHDVLVFDRVWIPSDSPDYSGETRAIYLITVTDPRWLEHLRPRMEWGTTAYDMDDHD
jgi:hypothetical protein